MISRLSDGDLFFDRGILQFLDGIPGLLGKLTIRGQPKVGLKVFQCVVTLVCSEQNIAGKQIGIGKIRFELNGQSDLRSGFNEVALVPINTSEREMTLP